MIAWRRRDDSWEAYVAVARDVVLITWEPASRLHPHGWAGHNSVAFTLTRYGGLFEMGLKRRLDVLLGGPG